MSIPARDSLVVKKGMKVECIAGEHHSAQFTVGKIYKVTRTRVWDKYAGVQVRDDKRERKDFNFIPDSNSYFWKYFKLV